ncbi:MAG: alcohol dehydrogenase catalytic domain-containing protein [Fimbriimonas ginsengisoli]|uniref:Alcohol dehydrogenase catalytic domain-containing protein n=1 Tax=Fimbriimonas ginsengisoli TaxID=1005039 RepID=A0A931LTX5_FIMGI|nr:alcohol dehydrogenase catalytic domain-containing protein [Fimbriimonas ginsengisoli]MBI3721933.1 alcohol dehydrogenase catalytic domain-containing protein [Fimbriimonas ginsengisoli]
MRLARYVGGGRVEIVDEPKPECPPGGLLVRTLACGLCSGELMQWYMDGKMPHVLGHEVCGEVVESQDESFPVATRVFAHHHAPCMQCERCRSGRHVHCKRWKRTRLDPGGMAEFFAAGTENLTDTMRVNDLRPIDAALIEPLACVAKSLRQAGIGAEMSAKVAVIGLGSMGLMHLLVLPRAAVGYELLLARREWATGLGLQARPPESPEEADVVIVCPGSRAALDLALKMVSAGGTVALFAPFPPGCSVELDLNQAYFRDLRLVTSYSCGPEDTAKAADWVRRGVVRAEQVVSDFIALKELPAAYQAMRAGEILKAMVVFS